MTYQVPESCPRCGSTDKNNEQYNYGYRCRQCSYSQNVMMGCTGVGPMSLPEDVTYYSLANIGNYQVYWHSAHDKETTTTVYPINHHGQYVASGFSYQGPVLELKQGLPYNITEERLKLLITFS